MVIDLSVFLVFVMPLEDVKYIFLFDSCSVFLFVKIYFEFDLHQTNCHSPRIF